MNEQELQDLQKMVEVAVNALEDIKAKDISVLETQDKTSLFARMIIASGDSTRQVKALANNVAVDLKEAGSKSSAPKATAANGRSSTQATSLSMSCSLQCATFTTSTPCGAEKNRVSTPVCKNLGTPPTKTVYPYKGRLKLESKQVSDGLLL